MQKTMTDKFFQTPVLAKILCKLSPKKILLN